MSDQSAIATDTEMLDWLDEQNAGYGDEIVFRISQCGCSGYRMQEFRNAEVSRTFAPKKNVREAIIEGMRREHELTKEK